MGVGELRGVGGVGYPCASLRLAVDPGRGNQFRNATLDAVSVIQN